MNQWKKIPKDKYGLFEVTEEFYNELPVVVYDEYDDSYEVIEQENYTDWQHDLSKQKYQYYLPIPKKGGEE